MDFLIFSTINWDNMDGARRPARWARELIRRGHRVLYVQAQPSLQHPAIQNLTVVSLLELGLGEQQFRRAWLGVDPGELEPFQNTLWDYLDAFERGRAEPRVALWCDPFVPLVLPFPRLRERGYFSVYDCRDDLQALAEFGYFFANSLAERFLVQECDLISVVSTTLLQKFKGYNLNANIRLLRQGIDLAEFRAPDVRPAPPADLVRGERTLGFWGLVNSFNVDPELLDHVACEHPTWTINLIGPEDPDPQQTPVAGRLHAFPNVHLLGEKPHARLTEYLCWFDVTLIPFPSNTFNRSRDPIKVFEYLAGHKPAVSAHTPQLAGMPYVYLADTPEGFLRAIETALEKPVDGAELDAYLADCTWPAQLDKLLAWIGELVPQNRILPPLSARQFYPPIDLPPNLRAYIAQTDELLDERTVYIKEMAREWQATQAYIKKLQRTHPFVWLKRLIRGR